MVKAQAKLQEVQANLELQASNDARDSERELLLAQHKAELEAARLELERYKVDADNRTRIVVAQIAHPKEEGNVEMDMTGDIVPQPSPSELMAQAVAMLAEQMARPKQVIRDETGRVVGVQ
jgi:multidrug efflux pump subunit AcrA (membrane-fusion protein)